jgi:curved DNA-binding protein CbpA
MEERNYYEVLQINNSAESEAIHAAYKRLSKEYQNSKFALYEYVLKMQELNKAYLTLINHDKRAEYDEGSDGELQSLEVPFEVDEESANKNKVKLESCNFCLDDEGDIKALGEISSINRKPIDRHLEIHFSMYDSTEKLIGTETTFGDKSGHRMTFNEYLFNKRKPSIPAKVRIYFVE